MTVSTVAADSARGAVPASRTAATSAATRRRHHRLAMLTIAAAPELRGVCADGKWTAMPLRLNEVEIDIPRLYGGTSAGAHHFAEAMVVGVGDIDRALG